MFLKLRYCALMFFMRCIFGQHPIEKIFENCHTNSTNFDSCIKTAFNDLRPFFKTGLYSEIFVFVNSDRSCVTAGNCVEDVEIPFASK